MALASSRHRGAGYAAAALVLYWPLSSTPTSGGWEMNLRTSRCWRSLNTVQVRGRLHLPVRPERSIPEYRIRVGFVEGAP
eukprot:126811-Alexandrium_andersonii.AAC.1